MAGKRKVDRVVQHSESEDFVSFADSTIEIKLTNGPKNGESIYVDLDLVSSLMAEIEDNPDFVTIYNNVAEYTAVLSMRDKRQLDAGMIDQERFDEAERDRASYRPAIYVEYKTAGYVALAKAVAEHTGYCPSGLAKMLCEMVRQRTSSAKKDFAGSPDSQMSTEPA